MTARRDPASERQIQAADPAASTWLSANAGSGKTRVLIDRVARLLLQGVAPQRILCLTYTKAAATEMQNRLFERLGTWAMKPDENLRDELGKLGVDSALDDALLAEARRLFARAIETPGGLRIQTIHSFCATLLRRFPLEAGVSPQFTELDDRAGRLIRDELLDRMADSVAPQAVADLARVFTGEDLSALAADVARNAAGFAHPFDPASLGLPEGTTTDSLLAQVFLGDEAELLSEAAQILAGGSANDQKAAEKMAKAAAADQGLATLPIFEAALLYGESKIEGRSYTAKGAAIATQATQPRLTHLQDRLDALGLRVEAARPLRLALRAAERARVLHDFAAAFLPLYAEAKTLRGALDFDDLIAHAKALLTDPDVAQWVLYRLDGGIDHILVDEAQDTSPDQWRVIELLAQELTAGEGARGEAERTVFVVGDPKQSIYSFQGADVAAFGAMRQLFMERLAPPGPGLTQLELEYSFRSSPAILRLVDLVFADLGNSDLGQMSRHIAFQDAMPGRIEVWPPITATEKPEDGEWFDPVDMVTEEHHAARIGKQVAARIAEVLESGVAIPSREGPRPVHAGDFLILVRRRNDIFAEVIRACKAAGLPIAGADRLKLGGEIAVRDLTAALAFLVLPEDDLSLAALLRSPLFGWSEGQLYRLAQPRPGYLWAALRDAPEAEETRAILQDLLDQADFLRPYEVLERLLTRHGGRRKLLARLGDEAEDGIDELLSQALAYEQTDVPSLTGFLTWLQSEEVEVKRQAEGAGKRIRVMTVHGAKGLEAPIVILPDTADLRPNDRDPILRMACGTPVWNGTSDAPPPLAEVIAKRKRLARAESMRLLYVALTRAQCWLMVGAAGNLASRKPAKKGDAKDSETLPAWYDLVEAGVKKLGAEAGPAGSLQVVFGEWPTAEQKPDVETVEDIARPDWMTRPAPAVQRQARPISPSDMGGAKTMPGEAGNPDALARGTALHLLLQHFPEAAPEARESLAARLLAGETWAADLTAEALRVIEANACIFSLPALAEVVITADLGGQRVLGSIDRLVFTADGLLVIDYKSNVIVPDSAAEIPEGIQRQMQAYLQSVSQLHPGRPVRGAILWTRTGRLMDCGDQIGTVTPR